MLSGAERDKKEILESLINTGYIIEFASEAIIEGTLSNDAIQGLYFVLSGVRDSLKKIVEEVENLNVVEVSAVVEAPAASDRKGNNNPTTPARVIKHTR